MAIFALQSPAGGFLDEDLKHFNKKFDDWCIQFDNLEDATLFASTLEKRNSVDIVEITPLSYPQYYFPNLQGDIHATRQVGNKILCILEPFMSSGFRLVLCDLDTKKFKITPTRYKSVLSVEGAFANFTE
jgi:hypothetical protein